MSQPALPSSPAKIEGQGFPTWLLKLWLQIALGAPSKIHFSDTE